MGFTFIGIGAILPCGFAVDVTRRHEYGAQMGDARGVVALLPVERAKLVELLSELTPEEWDRPTECPAWTVKGIALHLLGDDLSLLSRQRDGQPSPVVVEPTAGWQGLMNALDGFNQAWVERASYFSTGLLIELLAMTGTWTYHWYAGVDPDRLGEPVHWAGPEPAPYWLLGAREYMERWIHHQQMRRALGRPLLTERRLLSGALATAVQGFPAGFAALPAPAGTTVTLIAAGSAWTVERGPEAWSLHDGSPPSPTVSLAMDDETATALFSAGLPQDEVSGRLQPTGDADLGALLVAGLAAFFGRR
jgi:uncharacterized protein (TIGR03083 family)